MLQATVHVSDHNALETAHGALCTAYVPAGPCLDRRETPPHDVVQPVWFEGLAAEVRFAFGPVRDRLDLASAADEVLATRPDALPDLRNRLFDFPLIHLENAHREDVRCKLAL